MKQKTLWIGLVLVAILVVNCVACHSGKNKVVYEGQSAWVDSELVGQYPDWLLVRAYKRDSAVHRCKQPSSAKDFGTKKFAVNWKAVDTKLNVKGTVTVVHYEKGVEVQKDGKSWFYDFANMPHGPSREYRIFFAVESLLHPGVWEPVNLIVYETGKIKFSFVYSGGTDIGEVHSIETDYANAHGIKEEKDFYAPDMPHRVDF